MAIELQIQEEDRLTLEVESEGSTLLSGNETYRSLVKDYNVLTNKPVLNTDNDESLTPDESEVISGTINLHKVSKTGDYADLQNAPEYDPDTGNLSSTKFTGSGAGLTDIPSSAVDFDDLPVIGDYEGPSGTGRFVTFLQNESGDTYTNPYLLDLPVAMMYRVKTNSIAMNNGLGIGRQKLGIAYTSARYTGSTNTLFCFIAKTPIEIDTTTYAPVSELITDNIKLGFRLLGSVVYDDNSESVIDTHVVISYNNTSGWFASYNIFGNRNFGISLSTTFAEGKLSIIVGPAALQNTFEDTLSNFKVFRYCNLRIDYMGSSTGDYPSGTSDLSGLIEPSSGWSFSYYQHNNAQTWNDAISAVQPNIFGVLTDAKEDISNKVTSISSMSTDTQYPSAKAVYDALPDKTSDLVNDSDFVDEATVNTKLSTKADSAGASANYAAKLAASIPYGEVDDSSTSTVFTATVPGITELRDGVCMLLKNGQVTSAANFTININGLGAKPCYSNMATGNDSTPTAPTRETTIFNINYTMLFIYSEDIVEGGCWICYHGYDTNTNTVGYQIRTNSMRLPVSDQTGRYRLLFTSADNTHYVPANTSNSTSATAAKTVNQRPINPFGSIRYYGYTTILAAEALVGAGYQWQQYVVTMGYSFSDGSVALTAWDPVYLKCTPQSDGSAIIDATDPYVQTLSTTEDGKIYIYLGVANTATTFELTLEHPVYCYKNGAIRLWNESDSMMTFAYTASGVAVNSSRQIVIPIDGTKYKLLQLSVYNIDTDEILGNPSTIMFNNAGAGGYIVGTTDFISVSSTSAGITVTFPTTFRYANSQSLEVQALYKSII